MRELRCLICLGALVGVLVAGCDDPKVAATSETPDAPTAPAPTPAAPNVTGDPAPAPAPEPGEQVAVLVNGQPVPVAKLNDLLLRAYGMEMARHLVASELVRQEAGKQNVTVTDADVQAENDHTLQRLFGTVTAPKGDPAALKAAAAQREQLLAQLLEQKKVSRTQWQIAMRRSATLRKLAEREATVADQEVRDEFNSQFGQKIVVRHIQTATLTKAQELLTRLYGEKADFEDLARRHSAHPSAENGGLLPPISRRGGDASIPPAIRQAALAMTKIGEYSDPIQTGTSFHILKLERIIEPQNVKFEDIRDQLRAALLERNVLVLQPKILQRLIQKANIVYVHPVLKRQAAEGKQL